MKFSKWNRLDKFGFEKIKFNRAIVENNIFTFRLEYLITIRQYLIITAR